RVGEGGGLGGEGAAVAGHLGGLFKRRPVLDDGRAALGQGLVRPAEGSEDAAEFGQRRAQLAVQVVGVGVGGDELLLFAAGALEAAQRIVPLAAWRAVSA